MGSGERPAAGSPLVTLESSLAEIGVSAEGEEGRAADEVCHHVKLTQGFFGLLTHLAPRRFGKRS